MFLHPFLSGIAASLIGSAPMSQFSLADGCLRFAPALRRFAPCRFRFTPPFFVSKFCENCFDPLQKSLAKCFCILFCPESPLCSLAVRQCRNSHLQTVAFASLRLFVASLLVDSDSRLHFLCPNSVRIAYLPRTSSLRTKIPTATSNSPCRGIGTKKIQHLQNLRLVFHSLSRTTEGFLTMNRTLPVPPCNMLNMVLI